MGERAWEREHGRDDMGEREHGRYNMGEIAWERALESKSMREHGIESMG